MCCFTILSTKDYKPGFTGLRTDDSKEKRTDCARVEEPVREQMKNRSWVCSGGEQVYSYLFYVAQVTYAMKNIFLEHHPAMHSLMPDVETLLKETLLRQLYFVIIMQQATVC